MKKYIIILAAVVAFLGITFAMSQLISKMNEVAPGVSYDQAEQQRLSLLKSLPQDAVQRITVFNRYGTIQLQTITNGVALLSFASAMNSVQPYSPNHPQFDKQIYVVAEVKDGEPLEFHFCHIKSQPEVILYFVNKTGIEHVSLDMPRVPLCLSGCSATQIFGMIVHSVQYILLY